MRNRKRTTPLWALVTKVRKLTKKEGGFAATKIKKLYGKGAKEGSIVL